MAIIDIFSKRQKKLRGDIPDVYTYTELNQELRVQIIHIWRDMLKLADEMRLQFNIAEEVVKILCREYGVFDLNSSSRNEFNRDHFSELRNFFISEVKIERCLDAVEIFLFLADKSLQSDFCNTSQKVDELIEEPNRRFKDHGVGYQYVSGKIIRIDSEFIHSEVVKPALEFLNKPSYEGPRQEFLSAHESYRKGDTKKCLAECLKSLESVMKVICDKLGWKYPTDSTVKDLLKVCFENELIPRFWQSQYSALRSLLESSVPTGRNKMAVSHGQGSEIVTVPEYIASYMLHMTASSILFLAEAEADRKFFKK